MSHDEKGWQRTYAGPNQGQQYRCILCGAGGGSGRDGPKPLTYHCHECPGKSTMWPTPQYALYREKFLEAEKLREDLARTKEVPVYLYRRKGLQTWASCDHERFVELSTHPLFFTKVCYEQPDPQQ